MITFKFLCFAFVLQVSHKYACRNLKYYSPGHIWYSYITYQMNRSRLFELFSKEVRVKKQLQTFLRPYVQATLTVTGSF